jgi:release factor glutamine methyltransferase
VSPRAEPPPEVVGRLRAAGCVFAEDEAQLLVAAAATPADLEELLTRRISGLPLEQVLGWVDFCGVRISLRPGVFVPRRRTGLLVRRAARLVHPGSVVVDLCCGTGAVGAVLLTGEPALTLYAVDIDPAATACARANIAPLGGTAVTGDLFSPLPRTLLGRIDLIVANAPYVPTAAIERMPREARLHEARIALDGGADGLEVQRRLVAAAPEWLAQDGQLLVETSAGQAAHTAGIFARHGFTPRVIRAASLDATIVVGSLAGQAEPATRGAAPAPR